MSRWKLRSRPAQPDFYEGGGDQRRQSDATSASSEKITLKDKIEKGLEARHDLAESQKDLYAYAQIYTGTQPPMSPLQEWRVAQFCQDIHLKDPLGKALYLMVDKSKLGLLDTARPQEDARIVYTGAKSVATFQLMSSGNLVVTENYNHTCILKPTSTGAYETKSKVLSKQYCAK